MHCEFPILDFPERFLPQLDSLTYSTAEFNSSNSPNNDSAVQCRAFAYSAQTETNPSSTISFRIGIILDGFRNYTEYTSIGVFPPPEICENSTYLVFGTGGSTHLVVHVCHRIPGQICRSSNSDVDLFPRGERFFGCEGRC